MPEANQKRRMCALITFRKTRDIPELIDVTLGDKETLRTYIRNLDGNSIINVIAVLGHPPGSGRGHDGIIASALQFERPAQDLLNKDCRLDYSKFIHDYFQQGF